MHSKKPSLVSNYDNHQQSITFNPFINYQLITIAIIIIIIIIINQYYSNQMLQ